MPNSLSDLHTLHAWEDNQITERCTQGEYAGKVLQFKLVDKDGDINLSNCLVQYAVTRPDKTEDLLDCTVDNGVVKCNLTYSATSISGLVHGEVRVIGSNNSGTIKFYGVNLRVYKGVSDEAAEQSDEFTALVAALQKVVSITPNPDSENTYVVRLDDSIVQNGLNPVASGVIYDYLQGNYRQISFAHENNESSYDDGGVYIDDATDIKKMYYVRNSNGARVGILFCMQTPGYNYASQVKIDTYGNITTRVKTQESGEADYTWKSWTPVGTTRNIQDGAVTLPKLGADVIDNTLTSQGAAAEAKATGDKIRALGRLNEPYNLYDPTAEYTIIDASGGSHSSFREYVINPDGTITCTAYAQNAQRLLRNGSITLAVGTYTISGKMTLNDNVTDTTTQRLVRCRIGINTTVKDVALTTERGGDINVATNALGGWFAATFDLAQEEPLSFEMIPFYAAYGGADHPCTISELLIITGNAVGLYSDNTAIPADLRARYRIDQLETDVDNRMDQLAVQVDDRIDQLAVQGIDNRFRFSGTFSGGVKSGVTITRNGYNRLTLNGTATAGFNVEFAFHSFVISPLTLYYQIHSDDTETGRFWLTNGYFDANNAPHQLSPSISALNEWVKVVYPPSAVDSRTYLHIESGAVFNNTTIALLAVPSVISIDIRDAIDRDVLHNTFIADYNTADYQTAVDNYNAALVATGGDTEQFLFFTDPHLAVQTGGAAGMKPITEKYINLMQAVYNAAPLSYCICGGDWLGNSDTPATAASKLSYIDGFCKKKFRNLIPVIGNHDTNYQGTARFSVDMIKNLTQKTREEQRLYYRYDTPTARLYVFDTGTENEAVGDYQNSQLEWFANSLNTDNHVHIILTMHIVYYSPTNLQALQPISDKILEIAAAYNARGTVAVNGTTHDYSAATGTVSFCIAGHTHFDYESVVRTIPVVLTTNTTAGNTCTFDMCLVDWAAKKLYLKRVGSGSDREVNIL